LKPGQVVLVQGTGGVSIFALQVSNVLSHISLTTSC
jgi:NADPH:quinone reductase-like Zn-dependent oxidoreductase